MKRNVGGRGRTEARKRKAGGAVRGGWREPVGAGGMERVVAAAGPDAAERGDGAVQRRLRTISTRECMLKAAAKQVDGPAGELEQRDGRGSG